MINFNADLESLKTKCVNRFGWGSVCKAYKFELAFKTGTFKIGPHGTPLPA